MGSLADEIDTNCARLWVVAEKARARGSLSRDDIVFVRDTLPAALDAFPRITLLTARGSSSRWPGREHT